MDTLREEFGLWSAHSPSLKPCDIYGWGNPKAKVSRPNPNTTEEMKENIQRGIFSISQEEIYCVNVNFLWRCQDCVWNNREQFQHLL